MPTVELPVQLTLEDIIQAARQLPEAEQQELTRQISAWQSSSARTDSDLVAMARKGLTVRQQRRFRALLSKSEQGTLSKQELAEYQELAHLAQRLDIERLDALTELSRRCSLPLNVVVRNVRDGAEMSAE